MVFNTDKATALATTEENTYLVDISHKQWTKSNEEFWKCWAKKRSADNMLIGGGISKASIVNEFRESVQLAIDPDPDDESRGMMAALHKWRLTDKDIYELPLTPMDKEFEYSMRSLERLCAHSIRLFCICLALHKQVTHATRYTGATCSCACIHATLTIT